MIVVTKPASVTTTTTWFIVLQLYQVYQGWLVHLTGVIFQKSHKASIFFPTEWRVTGTLT